MFFCNRSFLLPVLQTIAESSTAFIKTHKMSCYIRLLLSFENMKLRFDSIFTACALQSIILLLTKFNFVQSLCKDSITSITHCQCRSFISLLSVCYEEQCVLKTFIDYLMCDCSKPPAPLPTLRWPLGGSATQSSRRWPCRLSGTLPRLKALAHQPHSSVKQTRSSTQSV